MITRRHLSYGAVGANMRTNAPAWADVLFGPCQTVQLAAGAVPLLLESVGFFKNQGGVRHDASGVLQLADQVVCKVAALGIGL